MKKIQSILNLSLIAGMIFISSCKKENTPPGSFQAQALHTNDSLLRTGTFQNGPYGRVSGEVYVYHTDSGYSIALSNFNSSDGPALHVFLSKEMKPVNSYDLGELKALTGDQNYTLNIQPDLNEYRYVSVHCVAFDHLFGYAPLN